MPSNVKLLAGASGGEPTDANFKNVTLLLHGDGSNGAQNNTFIDSSTNNFTITRNGNTTQGSFSPYGSNWSNYFDGSGDYLTVPDNAGFSYGTGDFTIECFVFASGLGATRRLYYHITTSTTQVTIYQLNTNYIGFYAANGGSVIVDMLSNTLLPANTWTHIAIVRSGNSFTLYQNGVSVATATSSASMPDPSGSVNIGALDTGNESWLGYISNFRVVKGTAVYTSAFTPSTTPLTAITNTSLLTCAYNRFRDGSTNNFTITRNGDVKVTSFAPFAPSSAYSTTTNGGSAYFDGNGDYLTAASNAAFGVGTGDFTIEAWIYPTGAWTSGGYNCLLQIDGTGIYFGQNNSGFGLRQSGTANIISYGTSPTLNTWTHVAIVRSGTTVTMYYNGTSVATATSSANFSSGGAWVGADAGPSNYYAGLISNMRLVKGTAVYTANFTPPSSPVTAITNTSILLNATNAAIFDNSMKNDLETVGNAQISTSVKKFGTGSIYVPVSGGCALIPNSQPLVLGTGNWTVEFWAYTDASGSKVYLDALNAANTTLNMEIYSSGTTIYWVKPGGAVAITGTGALSANTWQHIAACKSGSSTKLFVNGTQVGSTYTDNDTYDTARWEIGGRANLAYPIVGYMDDFRITTGVARYTSNFTAPTAPFPNK